MFQLAGGSEEDVTDRDSSDVSDVPTQGSQGAAANAQTQRLSDED